MKNMQEKNKVELRIEKFDVKENLVLEKMNNCQICFGSIKNFQKVIALLNL